MKILIATGIFPPDIGGPAKYAKALFEELSKEGHNVKIVAYRLEKKLPFGVRQILYFVRIFFAAFRANSIIALDTVSVGFPAVVASFVLGKKIVIRTGGDFLWESYLERTRQELPLPAFYKITPKLSFKEKVIARIHQFVLSYTDYIVFSTAWQRDIWTGFYNVLPEKIRIIENCYSEKKQSNIPSEKVFLGSARNIVMKNLGVVEEAFLLAKQKVPDIELDLKPYGGEEYERRLRDCYAVVIVSLGDISPNTIMEAISFNKPFILTKYNGLQNRLGDYPFIVDPHDIKGVAKAFVDLSNEVEYRKAIEAVKKISFVHTYGQIAKEFLQILKNNK